MEDHFWCSVCKTWTPWFHWLNNRVDSVWILGAEFQAGKCQGCTKVEVWRKTGDMGAK